MKETLPWFVVTASGHWTGGVVARCPNHRKKLFRKATLFFFKFFLFLFEVYITGTQMFVSSTKLDQRNLSLRYCRLAKGGTTVPTLFHLAVGPPPAVPGGLGPRAAGTARRH